MFKIVKQYDKDFHPKPVNKAFLNEDGTPKVLYHGTNAEFYTFRNEKIQTSHLGEGFYFVDNKEIADSFASRRTEEQEKYFKDSKVRDVETRNRPLSPYFIPVRFGLKYGNDEKTTLYVVVDQEKIKTTEVVKTPVLQTQDPEASRSVIYSISQIIPFVSKDALSYLSEALFEERKRGKSCAFLFCAHIM